jgi:hypothetical protein
MKKFCLILILVLGAFSVHAKKVEINFSSDPGFEKIGPDVTIAKLKISLALDDKPVDGKVWIELASPKKNSGLSTDFPIVEGTRLFDATGITQNGVLNLDYLFPIRGEYQLKITVESTDATFETSVHEQKFTLNENPEEVNNFIVLVVILVLFGLLSGFVIGRGSYLKAGVVLDEDGVL